MNRDSRRAFNWLSLYNELALINNKFVLKSNSLKCYSIKCSLLKTSSRLPNLEKSMNAGSATKCALNLYGAGELVDTFSA